MWVYEITVLKAPFIEEKKKGEKNYFLQGFKNSLLPKSMISLLENLRKCIDQCHCFQRCRSSRNKL